MSCDLLWPDCGQTDLPGRDMTGTRSRIENTNGIAGEEVCASRCHKRKDKHNRHRSAPLRAAVVAVAGAIRLVAAFLEMLWHKHFSVTIKDPALAHYTYSTLSTTLSIYVDATRGLCVEGPPKSLLYCSRAAAGRWHAWAITYLQCTGHVPLRGERESKKMERWGDEDERGKLSLVARVAGAGKQHLLARHFLHSSASPSSWSLQEAQQQSGNGLRAAGAHDGEALLCVMAA